MPTRIKFPRTPHIPWSNPKSDDVSMNLDAYSILCHSPVIVTEKMDGENTTLYADGLHARSLDSKHHISRSWIKNFWATNIRGKIPESMRICGENMYAVHSIKYKNLESYFLGFAVFVEDRCLSWADTLDVFQDLGIVSVRMLLDSRSGLTTSDIQALDYITRNSEGYVVRMSSHFSFENYSKCVGKYVRPNHVQTDEHWMNKPIELNKLKGEK